METETYNKTDVQLTYLYVFNVGMAPGLKAQVHVAVIYLENNVHVLLFSVLDSLTISFADI